MTNMEDANLKFRLRFSPYHLFFFIIFLIHLFLLYFFKKDFLIGGEDQIHLILKSLTISSCFDFNCEWAKELKDIYLNSELKSIVLERQISRTLSIYTPLFDLFLLLLLKLSLTFNQILIIVYLINFVFLSFSFIQTSNNFFKNKITFFLFVSIAGTLFISESFLILLSSPQLLCTSIFIILLNKFYEKKVTSIHLILLQVLMLGTHVISIFYIGIFFIVCFLNNKMRINQFLIRSLLIFFPFFIFYNFYSSDIISLSKLQVDEQNNTFIDNLSYFYYNHLQSLIVFSKAKFFLFFLILLLFKINKKLFYFTVSSLLFSLILIFHPNFLAILKKSIVFFDFLFIFIVFYFFDYYFYKKKEIEKALFLVSSILVIFICKSTFDNLIKFNNYTLRNNFNYLEFNDIRNILKNNKKKIIFKGSEENFYKTLLIGGLNQKINWIDLYNNEKLSKKIIPGEYLYIIDNPYFSSSRIVNNNINQYKNNIIIKENQKKLILDIDKSNNMPVYLYFHNRFLKKNKLSLFLNDKIYNEYEFKNKIKILLPNFDKSLKIEVVSNNIADFIGILDSKNNIIFSKDYYFKLGEERYEFSDFFTKINNNNNFKIPIINNCVILSQKSKPQSIIIFDLKCY
tara:strand:- start:2076 stop:3956 length:1881 start_codon:yes stop_codon:yes gene_type:complete